MAATRWPEAVIGASADEIPLGKRNPLRMDFRDMVSSAAMAAIAPARGVRADALTVTETAVYANW